MSKWNVSFKAPERFELIIFVLAFICFAIFDYAQNRYQDLGGKIHEISMFGISLINTFWIFLFAYIVLIVIGIIRSLLRRGTSYYWDYIIGMIMLVGVYYIVAGAIGAIYFQGDDHVAWFFNMAQIDIYHTLGVLAQIIGGVWFFVTD